MTPNHPRTETSRPDQVAATSMTGNTPRAASELTGTIPSECIRHLCLATAGVGAVYWLALIREYPTGLLLVLTSAWIVARALGALRSHITAVSVSLAFLLLLTVIEFPEPPLPQHALTDLCPFAYQMYLGMLVALIAADGLDLAQVCLRFRHVRNILISPSGRVDSQGGAA